MYYRCPCLFDAASCPHCRYVYVYQHRPYVGFHFLVASILASSPFCGGVGVSCTLSFCYMTLMCSPRIQAVARGNAARKVLQASSTIQPFDGDDWEAQGFVLRRTETLSTRVMRGLSKANRHAFHTLQFPKGSDEWKTFQHWLKWPKWQKTRGFDRKIQCSCWRSSSDCWRWPAGAPVRRERSFEIDMWAVVPKLLLVDDFRGSYFPNYWGLQ
jgi:hypothetical protein